jgi:hypothetical protein
MRLSRVVLQLLIFVVIAELGWSQDVVDRTVLPIPEPKPPVITELDARNVKAPAIFDGTTRVEPPHDPHYHFTVDMTNQAINWMQAQHALTPDKPFFVYFAPGAVHGPHHVFKEYIERYKGDFNSYCRFARDSGTIQRLHDFRSAS